MSLFDHDDSVVSAEVATVARRMHEYLADVSTDVRNVVADCVPELAADDRVDGLLGASVQENVNAALHILQHEIRSAVAPNAAIEFTRSLAQRAVGVTALLRAYRVGQTRFQRDFIAELLRGREGDHLEGRAALSMVEIVSDYVDNVVEQLVETYGQAREEWLSHRSAIYVQRVQTLLRERTVPVDVAQEMLGDYRLAQNHLGAVIWCDEARAESSTLSFLSLFSLKLAEAAECVDPPLFIPYDESIAWLWLPLGGRGEISRARLENSADADGDRISIAIGEPLPSLSGFRRTHQQALLARAVAAAAKPSLSRFTAFTDVAAITTLCADLDAARSWVGEVLGSLAIDEERCSVLRETALVFLATGGSFTATANQMILHRNTAQYRIRKAEELRGRPLRESRLDVELALLACHHLGSAVLQPPPGAERPPVATQPQELVRAHEGGARFRPADTLTLER